MNHALTDHESDIWRAFLAVQPTAASDEVFERLDPAMQRMVVKVFCRWMAPVLTADAPMPGNWRLDPRIVTRIAKMRYESGLTPRQIANALNAESIATASGNEWEIGDVKSLLTRIDRQIDRHLKDENVA